MGNEHLIGSPRNKGLGTKMQTCFTNPMVEGIAYYVAWAVLILVCVCLGIGAFCLFLGIWDIFTRLLTRMDIFFCTDLGITVQALVVTAVVIVIAVFLRTKS